uniref:Uncharacterized protein n=1 Tax=Cacopsylla melanoneura TaxID=428564 RepID=A0A8D9F0A7_9HEMI
MTLSTNCRIGSDTIPYFVGIRYKSKSITFKWTVFNIFVIIENKNNGNLKFRSFNLLNSISTLNEKEIKKKKEEGRGGGGRKEPHPEPNKTRPFRFKPVPQNR